MTRDELEEYSMGVILALHFSLKKGVALSGEKAEIATTKELHQIHNMGS